MMIIIIINIAITIDSNTKILITNMMMKKVTKNAEDIAMEDLAIAKCSVAISSAHQDEADDDDDDDDYAGAVADNDDDEADDNDDDDDFEPVELEEGGAPGWNFSDPELLLTTNFGPTTKLVGITQTTANIFSIIIFLQSKFLMCFEFANFDGAFALVRAVLKGDEVEQ